MKDPSSPVEVGKRLKAIRKALNMRQSKLCQLANISPQAWNNAETGDNLLTIPSAVELCRVTGATMDFIYRGQVSGLPALMLEKIMKADHA